VVGRRLLDAAYREDLGGVRTGTRWPRLKATRHGFDRIERQEPVAEEPAALLHGLGITSATLAAELDDAVANLAVAYQRRPEPPAAGVDLDAQAIAYERLATEGHNLHPCGRTRLGWNAADVLAYDQEADRVPVAFVAIRKDRHLGDDIGALLGATYPDVPEAPAGYVVQPVHPWQREGVLRQRYDEVIALPGGIDATPTLALRTLLLPPDRAGRRHYLKVSLDIQVTSTRRSISIASTHNGPRISDLLARLAGGDDRVVLMPEVAGAALQDGRDASAILRGGLGARHDADEVAMTAAALPARSGGTTLLHAMVTRSGLAPIKFLESYARLLLTPILRMLDAGVGLEAHLQNCVPIFRAGVPTRMAFRDFAGLRLHLPRLAARSIRPALWPGSVTATTSIDDVRAKVGYTALQAHLGEIVVRLAETDGLDETAAWQSLAGIIDDIYATERLDAADHAFFRAPTMPHKALVRMRLAGSGDVYVPVANPMHRA
jgi:siderophore synthetase component